MYRHIVTKANNINYDKNSCNRSRVDTCGRTDGRTDGRTRIRQYERFARMREGLKIKIGVGKWEGEGEGDRMLNQEGRKI